MSMKIKAAILVTSFAVLMFVVVGSLGGVHASSNDGSYRQLQVYSEVLSRVRTEYVEEPNIPKVTDGALHGLLESLDSNSSYMSPDAYKAFKDRKSESKGGIGAVVSKRFGYAAVVAVLPGSPAEKAGIEQTDIFESIEGQSTREMSLPEIRSLIAGAPGSTLNVAVVRARKAEPQKISITRDVVIIPPVADKMMDDGIGYVKVETLTKGKALELFVDTPKYKSRRFDDVPYLDISARYDNGSLVLNVVNRHRDQPVETEFEVEDKQFSGAVAVSEVNGPDIKSENDFDKTTVKPSDRSVTPDGRRLRCRFPPHSYSMLKATLV